MAAWLKNYIEEAIWLRETREQRAEIIKRLKADRESERKPGGIKSVSESEIPF